MYRLVVGIVVPCLVFVWPDPAGAQATPPRFEVGGQVSSAISGQFDGTDVGLGGRFSWHPARVVGIESEIDFYPSDFPDRPPFSSGRVEGLFGVTAGPWLGRARPFAKVRSGFLSLGEAPGPFPCVLIYPPPLSCELASGGTLLTFDIGGGVEVLATRKTFVRIDAGDRLLKYPGPVIDNDGNRQDDSFFGHDFRFAVGAGLYF